jgi:hypothetical protein
VLLCLACKKEVKHDLKVFRGQWEELKKEYTTKEIWKSEYKDLKGFGFVLVGKDTVFKEQIQIKAIYGEWYYIVRLNDAKNEEYFKLKNTQKNEWIFENPKNDFPQKIRYKFQKSIWMHVILEGKEQKENKKVIYKFKRKT